MPETLFSEDFELRKKESVKPDYLVYKTNPLLMVRDEMAIMQARFFTAYLCKVDPDDPSTYKARFSLAAFCKMLDVDTSNIKKLKEDCRTIRKMGFDFIEYRRKHGEKIDPMLMDEVSLFSRFTISGNNADGYFVEVTPTEEMKHLLLNQRKYGFVSYEARNTLVLSTKRYMRMYEFLKRSEGKGITVDIDTLKAYLGLSADDYPKMRDFKRDVLDKGIKEINEKTDISVTYEPKKKGQGGRIVGFHFTVKRKQAMLALPEAAADEEEKPLVLSDKDIEDFNSCERSDGEAPALQQPKKRGRPKKVQEPAPAEPKRQPTIYELDLMATIPEEVHKGDLLRVDAVMDVIRKYIPYPEPLLFIEEGMTLQEASRAAADEFNEIILDKIYSFNVQEYNIRKSGIVNKEAHFKYYLVALEGWLISHT